MSVAISLPPPRFLEQIDFFTLLEVFQDAAGFHGHVTLADFRVFRIGKFEERVFVRHGRRERERILHAIDIQDKALAVLRLRQRSRRRDGSGASSSRLGVFGVGVVQRLRAGIRELVAVRFRQQFDGVVFIEGKDAIGVQRHILGIDFRICRSREREKRRAVRLRGGSELERILHAVDLQDEVVAIRRHFARRRDGGGFILVRVGGRRQFFASCATS